MDESNITIYRDVMSLVGNLSLAAAATIIFTFSVVTGNISLSLISGLLIGLPIGLLKKRFYGRGW